MNGGGVSAQVARPADAEAATHPIPPLAQDEIGNGSVTALSLDAPPPCAQRPRPTRFKTDSP